VMGESKTVVGFVLELGLLSDSDAEETVLA
jgi:hypothetical protein